jgi:hypothetical protein
VTVLRARDSLLDVRHVGKIKRLNGLGTAVEIVGRSFAEAAVRGREDLGALSGDCGERFAGRRGGVADVSATHDPDGHKPHEEQPDE